MQALPHHYQVSACGESSGSIVISTQTAAAIETNPPPGFGGPEGYWTPEDLLVGAVADCFILTFRAISSASGFEWLQLTCEANGTLDKEDKQFKFVAINLMATLTIAEGVDIEKAKRLLMRSEAGCLVTNTLACPVTLDINIIS